MVALQLFLASYALLWAQVLSAGPVTLLRDLVQWNIVGIPIIHEKSTWNFDPDEGKQRQVTYEMFNGRLGNVAIARLGLGYDS